MLSFFSERPVHQLSDALMQPLHYSAFHHVESFTAPQFTLSVTVHCTVHRSVHYAVCGAVCIALAQSKCFTAWHCAEYCTANRITVVL